MRESERTVVALDRFFEVAAFEWSGKDRSPGAAVRQRHALLDYFASLPDQPIKRSEAAWIWDAEALTESLDSVKPVTGGFLEMDSATVDWVRQLAEKKGLRTQDLALQLIRDGIEAEEIAAAVSVGTYFDTLCQHGADYLMELHVFDGRDGEPEDIHLLRHARGHFMKAWTEIDELIDGTWQPFRHGLGTPGSQKRQRHCYQEISREEGIRLVYENAIPESLRFDIVLRKIASPINSNVHSPNDASTKGMSRSAPQLNPSPVFPADQVALQRRRRLPETRAAHKAFVTGSLA